MDKKLEDKKCKEQSGNRGVYLAPKLKVFGPVGALTQSGTQGVAEDFGPGQSLKKM